jgi:DNA repair exonuclease SbcCD ATPase subunit
VRAAWSVVIQREHELDRCQEATEGTEADLKKREENLTLIEHDLDTKAETLLAWEAAVESHEECLNVLSSQVKASEQRLVADQEKFEADKQLVATYRERNSSKRALLEADKKTWQGTVLQLEGGGGSQGGERVSRGEESRAGRGGSGDMHAWGPPLGRAWTGVSLRDIAALWDQLRWFKEELQNIQEDRAAEASKLEMDFNQT